MNPRSALLVIDAQVNMFDPMHSVHAADELLARLIALVARAREAGATIVFIRNCGGEGDPDVRGTRGWELHPQLQPAAADRLLDKTTCDTFASTTLGEDLGALDIHHVVIAGLQSDWCIRETTLGALARGFEVTLISNGHSTYDGKTRAAHETIRAVNAEFDGRVKLISAEAVPFA
jgi:nicotinamidase-related amidase